MIGEFRVLLRVVANEATVDLRELEETSDIWVVEEAFLFEAGLKILFDELEIHKVGAREGERLRSAN